MEAFYNFLGKACLREAEGALLGFLCTSGSRLREQRKTQTSTDTQLAVAALHVRGSAALADTGASGRDFNAYLSLDLETLIPATVRVHPNYYSKAAWRTPTRL